MSLRLAIFARRTPRPEPQHDRYRSEALRRGHVVVDVDIAAFVAGPIDIALAGAIVIGGQRVDDVDVVLVGPLPGAGARTSPDGLTLSSTDHAARTTAQHERHLLAVSVVQELEDRGIAVLSPTSSFRFDAKPAQLWALQRAGLPLPETRIVDDAASARGDVIVKAIRGGPVRTDTPLSRGRPMIVQERLRGDDLRAVVVGGRCVCVGRFPEDDADVVDVRERPGFVDGSARWLADDDAEAAALAVRAAAACGVDVAAVDLKRTARGVVVLEVNRTPVVVDLADDLQVDIAAAVIDLVERRARR